MKRNVKMAGRPAIDLLEEAAHLLRSAPASAYAWYLLGTIPFLLMLLYFWTDMSWSDDARRGCAIEALVLSFFFLWMEWAHAIFARQLRQHIGLGPVEKLDMGKLWRAWLNQSIIQPSKLFILPIALVATLPLAWVHAFYESATAVADESSLRDLWNKSWQHARLWPRQNHFALALVILFYLLTSFNILLLVIILPHLAKTFTGVENVFTLSLFSAFNSTMLAVVGAATYLCCAPLTKAIHVLRCFYGESLRSGEDLQIEFRRARAKSLAVAALIALACIVPLSAARADSARPPITAEALNRSIEETVSAPEFRWRRPRLEEEAAKSKAESWLERFAKKSLHALGRWIRSIQRWLDKHWHQAAPSVKASQLDGGGAVRTTLELVLVILGVALILMLAWSIRNYIIRSRAAPPAEGVAKKIDLLDESVTAEQLPEEGWLQMAHEAIGRGDLRAGLRALFLAALAHLGQSEAIALAKYKSNRDYHVELRRRRPDQGRLHDAFLENMRDLERVWYGRHSAQNELIVRAEQNLQLIRAA